MKHAVFPLREAERLAELYRYGILDTAPEQALDDLVHLAASICHAPIAVISLVDAERQWFKSKIGLTANQTSRIIAFCAHTILGDELFVVPDASVDDRFTDNPLVAGDPHIRFYCGAPLTTPAGHHIGTLGVIDHVPRELSQEQLAAMRVLSHQVMDHLNLNRRHKELLTAVGERLKVEQALLASQVKFQQLSDCTTAGIYIYSGERFLYANPAAGAITGYSLEELRSLTLWDLVHPDFQQPLKERVKAVEAGEVAPSHLEFPIIAKDKQIRWLDFSAASIEFDGQSARIGTAIDITERKQAEASVRRQAALLDQAYDPVFAWEFGGPIVYWNRGAEQLYGIPSGDALGCQPHQLLQTQFPVSVQACEEELERTGRWKGELRHRARDGSMLIVDSRMIVVHEHGARLVLEANRDITATKQAEASLKASEERFALAVEGTEAGIWDWDMVADRVYYSPRWKSMLGYDQQDLPDVYSTWEALIHPEDREQVLTTLRAYLEGKTARYEVEHRLRHKNGSYRWILARGALLRDASGRPYRMAGSHLDVSERKQAEDLKTVERQALEQVSRNKPLSETMEFLVHSIESLSDGAVCSILLVGAEGRTLRRGAVPTLPELFSRAVDGAPIGPQHGSCGTAAYRKAPVIVMDIATDPLWTPWTEATDLALQHGLKACTSVPIIGAAGDVLGTYAMYYRTTRGPTDFELDLMRTSGQLLSIAIERARAKKALHQSEERFRLVAEVTNDVLWEWDLATDTVWTSPNTPNKIGYDFSQEPSSGAWLSCMHPKDRDRVVRHLNECLRSGTHMFSDEYRFRLGDGSYGVFLDKGQIIRDAEGKPVRIIGTMIDVTAPKRAYASLEQAYTRLQRLSRELQMAEEKERRRLSRELHDEFGQLLSALRLSLARVREELAKHPGLKGAMIDKNVTVATKAAERLLVSLREMVRGLRPAVLDELGLVAALRSMAEDVREGAGLDCRLSVEPEKVGSIVGQELEGALFRIAQELLTNVVRHAKATRADITVRYADGRVTLMVQDNGRGGRLTVAKGRYGLRGIRERTELLGGQVEIRSGRGIGTTVTVAIPVQPSSPRPRSAGSTGLRATVSRPRREHGKKV